MTNYFGKISDTSAVENLHPAFKAAFDFLKRDDIFSLPEGRYDIIGGGKCYAAIESPLLRLPNQAKCEAHKKYIDIHFPLSGPEYMGIGVTPEEIIQNGAAFDNDVAFFDVDVEFKKINVGEFALIFPPHCAHKSVLTMDEIRPLKKVIVKIACEDEVHS
jgi:YhcH/YjgK/YiaL family protein